MPFRCLHRARRRGGAGASDLPPVYRCEAAFAKGRPLLEVDGYKIHASRREATGEAEVHTRDTDLIYVLDGSATIVTGGSVVAPILTAAEEIRGSAIEGGESRTLGKGDVLVVPNGVPHWFKTVEPPLLYYVVKVASTAAPSTEHQALGTATAPSTEHRAPGTRPGGSR